MQVSRYELRKLINANLDNWKFWAKDKATADGVATYFPLTHGNVSNLTVSGTAVTYTLDTRRGMVMFTSAPAAGTLYFVYQWAVWTDEYLNDLINQALALAAYRGAPRALSPALLDAACESYFVDDRDAAPDAAFAGG